MDERLARWSDSIVVGGGERGEKGCATWALAAVALVIMVAYSAVAAVYELGRRVGAAEAARAAERERPALLEEAARAILDEAGREFSPVDAEGEA